MLNSSGDNKPYLTLPYLTFPVVMKYRFILYHVLELLKCPMRGRNKINSFIHSTNENVKEKIALHSMDKDFQQAEFS